MESIFNEETLKNEIYRTWGDAGAHAQIFNQIINENKKLKAELDFFNSEAGKLLEQAKDLEATTKSINESHKEQMKYLQKLLSDNEKELKHNKMVIHDALIALEKIKKPSTILSFMWPDFESVKEILKKS